MKAQQVQAGPASPLSLFGWTLWVSCLLGTPATGLMSERLGLKTALASISGEPLSHLQPNTGSEAGKGRPEVGGG